MSADRASAEGLRAALPILDTMIDRQTLTGAVRVREIIRAVEADRASAEGLRHRRRSPCCSDEARRYLALRSSESDHPHPCQQCDQTIDYWTQRALRSSESDTETSDPDLHMYQQGKQVFADAIADPADRASSEMLADIVRDISALSVFTIPTGDYIDRADVLDILRRYGD